MQSNKYEALYTNQGHSIRHLKIEAKRLRERGLSLNDAQNRIAIAIGYSSWQELASQPNNPMRDQFFRDVYQNGLSETLTKRNYKEFIKEKGLPDNKESFRIFAVKYWENYKSLNFDKMTTIVEPLSPEALQIEIVKHLKAGGAEGLIPKGLDSRTLETMAFISQNFMEKSFSEHPISTKYMSNVFKVVLLLTSYLSKSPKGEISEDELCDRVSTYLMWCQMEYISRNTAIKINTPNLNDIFDGSSEVTIEFQNIFNL